MKIEFNESTNIKQYEKAIETEMDSHIKHFEKEIAKIRTGRAHPSMVEDIKVMAYGSMMPLKEVGAVTAPDVSLLVIQPWDNNLIPDIEKAIINSDIGINPTNDGAVIRLPIPKMSSSRRDDLAKVLGQKLEIAKVAIRNVRKDVQNSIRDAEKNKKVSEDSSKRLQDMLQKVTDKLIASTDQMATKKESEIKAL